MAGRRDQRESAPKKITKLLTADQTCPVVGLHWQTELPVPVLLEPAPHATQGGSPLAPDVGLLK